MMKTTKASKLAPLWPQHPKAIEGGPNVVAHIDATQEFIDRPRFKNLFMATGLLELTGTATRDACRIKAGTPLKDLERVGSDLYRVLLDAAGRADR